MSHLAHHAKKSSPLKTLLRKLSMKLIQCNSQKAKIINIIKIEVEYIIMKKA